MFSAFYKTLNSFHAGSHSECVARGRRGESRGADDTLRSICRSLQVWNSLVIWSYLVTRLYLYCTHITIYNL